MDALIIIIHLVVVIAQFIGSANMPQNGHG
jgi:hypothetical protein